MKITGTLLIVAGILILIYHGFTYTKKEPELKIGSVEVTSENKKMIPIPPVLGLVSIAGGTALLLTSARRDAA